MAWQLIYTSAPRLLEAGRSGFGSVARHRQISPLLVSAIERASQFSRQPGMDPGRVIFSHRIVPISGGRFHVLSCIRDAGADYTGRTNHIAHHLIAEAREIAQLGSQGPSPADVLLAMPWVERWDEPPRYLEATEEVHLAGFTPQTGGDGAHWAQVTGNAAHAWLLAAGEAIRGAYLIPPPGVDLRWLIADSLRLAPERLWQTSFTTSLQSKDEISDYRWVGLETGSPLRNETSGSGRPMLDLTQPESLPQPEIPTAQLASAPKSLGDLVKIKTPIDGALEGGSQFLEELLRRQGPTAQDSHRRAPVLQTENRQQRTQWDEGVRSHVPGWAWITAAGVLVAACLGFFVVKPIIEQLNAQKIVASALGPSDYFGDEPARMKIAKVLLPNLFPDSKSSETAKLTAEAINRIATALMRGNFDSFNPEDIAALKGLAQSGASPPPGAITELYRLLTAAQDRSRWEPSLKSAMEAAALQQSTHDEVNKAIPRSRYERLNKTLGDYSDVQVAKAEYDLLASNASIQPPNSAAKFRTSIAGLRVSMRDNENAKVFLKKAEKLVELWELTEPGSGHPDSGKIAALKKKLGDNADQRPEWLSRRVAAMLNADAETFASTLPTDAKSPPPRPAVPLYFVSDIVSLENAHFRGLRKNLIYFLSSPVEAKPRKLLDPAKDGKLWLNVRDDKAPAFVVTEDPPQIMPEAASRALETPFVLFGREDSDREAIQIYVASASDKPLFPPTRKIGLARAGNVLSIDFQKLALPGIPKTPLKLGLPEEYTVPGLSDGSLPLADDGKADIGGLLKEMAARREAKTKEIGKLKSDLALNKEPSRADFADRKALIIQAAKLEKKKDSQVFDELGKESDSPFRQCGNLIFALMHHANFHGSEELFTLGQDLSKLPEEAELTVRNEKLMAASVGLDHVLASMTAEIRQAKANRDAALTQEPKRRIEQEIEQLTKNKRMYEPILLKLEELVDSLLPETPRAREAREASELQLNAMITGAQREIDQISTNPLLTLPSDRVPPGTYRLLAQTEHGKDVLLLKIEAAQ